MGFRNILLIDDDEDDHEIFQMAVKDVSESVVCYVLEDASKALISLRSSELNPDVIFLDLNMPIMNGQQFLKEIKTIAGLKDIPVIIYSTTSNAKTKELVKGLGAQDFITKPGDIDSLVQVLKPFLQ